MVITGSTISSQVIGQKYSFGGSDFWGFPEERTSTCRANGFDKFYNDELKLFLQENDLGAYDPITLEKGFFTETSKTRNGLFNTHVQSQMSKIGEDYKFNFKENIQGKFDKNKSNEEIGADISGFVQDAVKNGLGKSSAQKYVI